MMYRLVFLYFDIILLVSANPLPLTWAPPCQQNCYSNTELSRSYRSPVHNTYHQGTAIQPHQTQSTNQINQEFINKILLNPTLKTLLDPKTKLYNQNGVEVATQGVSSSSLTPNIVNNYIIVPPEILESLNDQIKSKEDRRRRIAKRKRQQRLDNGEREKSKDIDKEGQKTLDKTGTRRESDVVKMKSSADDELINNNNRTKSRRKQKNRRNKKVDDAVKKNVEFVVNEDKLTNNSNINDTYVITKESNDNLNKTLIEQDVREEIFTIPAGLLRFTPNNDTSKGKVKNKQNNETHVKQYEKKEISTEASTLLKSTSNNDTFKDGGKRRKIRLSINAVQKNRQEEAIIQDLHNKFPGIPKNVVKSLLSYLKNQMQTEQLGVNPFYYPNTITYDQLYNPQNLGNRVSGRNRNNRKKNRKSKTKSTLASNKDLVTKNPSNITAEITPNYLNNTKICNCTRNTTNVESVKEEKTKEKLFNTLSKNISVDPNREQSNSNIINSLKDAKSNNYNLKLNENMVKINETPELGMEDVVPTVLVNDILNDYYPDFIEDNKRYSENYEIDEKNFNYNNSKELSSEKLKEHNNNIISELATERNTYKTDYFRSFLNNEKVVAPAAFVIPEEVEFKTPPILENPDFETKNIKHLNSRDTQFSFDEYINKVSSYSDVKTPKYQYNVKAPSDYKRTKTSDIETVFATPKVIKYGSVPLLGDESEIFDDALRLSSGVSKTGYLKDGDDMTIVLATSYPEYQDEI